MEVSALKVQLQDLVLKREEVEGDVALRSERLHAAGVGLKDSLVDKEGFPRGDIDIASVRTDRQRIAELTNDHKALTKQIDKLLQELHAAAKPGPSVSQQAAAAAPAGAGPARASRTQQESAEPVQRPIALVDEVFQASPAAAAGIQIGDMLVSLAGVTWSGAGSSTQALQRVAAAVQAGEGKQLEAIVLRQGTPVHLQLKPERWQGHGLLGCHLRPLG